MRVKLLVASFMQPMAAYLGAAGRAGQARCGPPRADTLVDLVVWIRRPGARSDPPAPAEFVDRADAIATDELLAAAK
jgi:hypothetical protein